MSRPVPDQFRRLIVGAVGVGVLWALAPVAALASRVRTPAQTTGPFYPRELPLDSDNDLATVVGAPTGARGTIAHVSGRVLDDNERPVRDARVEIWQADAFGRYHHPADRRDAPLDPGFQGYGQTMTANDGAYRFRTIRPVPYPGRTPHIHFAITARGGVRLVTQMYVAGEPLNARDAVLNGVRDPAARAAVIVDLKPAPDIEPGALAATFDIVLGAGTRPG